MALHRSRRQALSFAQAMLAAVLLMPFTGCTSAGAPWWKMQRTPPPVEFRQFYLAAYNPDDGDPRLRMYNVSMGGDFTEAMPAEPEAWFAPSDFRLLFGRALDAVISGVEDGTVQTGSFALNYDPAQALWTVQGNGERLVVLAASKATAEALGARTRIFEAFAGWAREGADGMPHLSLEAPEPLEQLNPLGKVFALTDVFEQGLALVGPPREEDATSSAPVTTALVIPEDDDDGTPWEQLVRAYARVNIEYPELRAVTLAQWILESGWGTSKLATNAYNFGGLKYDRDLGEDISRYSYGRSSYCRFASPAHFIECYWRFIDNNNRFYGGWREAAERGGPEEYLRHIVYRGYLGGPKWKKDRYIRQVTALIPKAQALLE